MKGKSMYCFFVLLTMLICSGCGHSVWKTVSPVEQKPVNRMLTKIVILPFADYTPSPSPYTYTRRDRLVTEALYDELYRTGFMPAIEEDVVRYMIDKKIIRPICPGDSNSGIEEEINNDEWSPAMKEELKKLYNSSRYNNFNEYGKKIDLIALDKSAVQEIGKNFDSNYLIRGRIIVFKSGDENTFNPLKTGILPFLLETGGRTILGVARSHRYDSLGKLSFTPMINTVQVRMFVQDTETGDVLWSNRAEVRVTPKTIYGEHDRDILFAEAIKGAVRALVDKFASDFASGKLPRTQDQNDRPLSTKGMANKQIEIEASVADAREAAMLAKQYAMEANRAAEEARQAAMEAVKAKKETKKISAHTEKTFEKLNAK